MSWFTASSCVVYLGFISDCTRLDSMYGLSSGLCYISCSVYVWFMFGVCLVYVGFMFGFNVVHVWFIVGPCLVYVWLNAGYVGRYVPFMLGLMLFHLWFALGRCPVKLLVYLRFMAGLFLVYLGLDWIGSNFWFTVLAYLGLCPMCVMFMLGVCLV